METFEIDPDARYLVTLAKPVPMGVRRLLPRDQHRMLGHVLQQIVNDNGWEAIADVHAIG